MRLNEHKGKARWDDKTTTTRLDHDGNDEDNRLANKEKSTEAAGNGNNLALTTSPSIAADIGLSEAKAVARRRSLFSLVMSLAVGAVAWSADAPCLPLLAGLFAVVGVSMRSVSLFRSRDARRRGGPAADAVALLSLNWFLLGVLTSPMLPGVARAVVPRALGPALTWVAATPPAPL